MPGIHHDDEEEILITDGENVSIKDTENKLKTRYILGLLGFVGLANVYAMRVNLSVAIVAMVNTTSEENGSNMASSLLSSLLPAPVFHPMTWIIRNSSLPSDVCIPSQADLNPIPDVDKGEFSWDERTQGLVLGSFFYGYVATQIPGGRLAELIGGRHVFGLGVLLTGIFTLLTPPVARLSKYWGIAPFLILRVLEGLSEGVTFPAIMAMMAKWVPPSERSRFSAVVYTGAMFGTVISMPISGLLCGIKLPVYWWLFGPGGWPLAFYIFGALGVFWYIAWMGMISDSPATHPSICPHERQFIEWSLKQNNNHHAHENNEQGEQISGFLTEDSSSAKVPWWHLLKSLPLWATLVTMSGQSWAFYTLLTELPTYMANVLHFDIKKNSFLSALPYLATWLSSLPFSWVADWLCSSAYVSTTTSLKIFNSIAVMLPSLGLIGAGYAGCHSNVILILLVLNGVFGGAAYAGVQVNHLALSPRLAGTLYGITNCISNICGFLAPYATGSIINGHETITRWRSVFLISASVNMIGNIFYALFASGELQPWDDPNFNSEEVPSQNSSQQASTSRSGLINDGETD